MPTHTVVLIPGDGIGPEIAASVKAVFAAANAPVEFIERLAGVAALEAGHATPLPQQTIETIQHHELALKGPCTTPIGKGFRSVNVQLRKELDLWAAVRPIKSIPGVDTRYEDVDIIIVRENTEGLYSGVETKIVDDVVISMKVATTKACRRIAHGTFRFATVRGRAKVSVFHKANIMKMTDGLFLDECRKVHRREYPNITYEEVIVDAGSMRLVQDPSQFDIILCENLYGDIISDLCAGFVGGLGVTPGANYGDRIVVFEAVHGSAPDIAGQDRANPLALMMSGVSLLDHIAEKRTDPDATRAARSIEAAYLDALESGDKTRDIGGQLGTRAFTQAIISRLA